MIIRSRMLTAAAITAITAITTVLLVCAGCSHQSTEEVNDTSNDPTATTDSADGPTGSVAQPTKRNCSLDAQIKGANACAAGPGVTRCIENCWVAWDLCNL